MHFCCYGHTNILGTHSTTFEFTKDRALTKNGDCIIGIKADFDAQEIKEFVKNNDKIKIILEANNIKEEIAAEINPRFNDEKELVIRLGEFSSKRTLAVNADKAAKHLNRELIKLMQNPEQKMHVKIELILKED